MPSIKVMNQTIAKFLYGDGELMLDNYYHLKKAKHNQQALNASFHEDYNILMSAFKKAMGAGKKISWNETKDKTMWYAIYPNTELIDIQDKKTKLHKVYREVTSYTCAFTENGNGRMGHGAKLNKDFDKKTIILAMHYSLYRLIKNGLEY